MLFEAWDQVRSKRLGDKIVVNNLDYLFNSCDERAPYNSPTRALYVGGLSNVWLAAMPAYIGLTQVQREEF